MVTKSFDDVVQEERPIQSASIDMEGGNMPSCMTLFDRYLSCYSLRNQFFSLYRHGQAASNCSAKWEDFKLCLDSRDLSPEKRREAWVQRRAEWWASRRQGMSSENVWDTKEYPADTADRYASLRT